MKLHSDPFRRSPRYGGVMSDLGARRHYDHRYQGQEGLESLFSLAMPYVLVRTDDRVNCMCATDGNTGDDKCVRCFGTGKVVVSLDRIQAYVSKSSPDTQSTPAGWEPNDRKTIYTGRWVCARMGDLVLEVGWNVPNEFVFQNGRVQTVDNVYQVKQNNHIGFQHVSYSELSTIMAASRRPTVEDMILQAPILPPWRNCLAP